MFRHLLLPCTNCSNIWLIEHLNDQIAISACFISFTIHHIYSALLPTIWFSKQVRARLISFKVQNKWTDASSFLENPLLSSYLLFSFCLSQYHWMVNERIGWFQKSPCPVLVWNPIWELSVGFLISCKWKHSYHYIRSC